MSRFDRVVAAITGNTKFAIAAMVLLTLALGAGAVNVEESSSLNQFQTETPESEKLDFVRNNFQAGDANTSTAQVIVRGDDVLSKDAYLASLRFQQAIRADPAIRDTLVENDSTVGVANAVATAAIRLESARQLRQEAQALQRERAAIEENRTALQQRSDALNATAERLRRALGVVRQNPQANVTEQFRAADADSPVDLDASDRQRFLRAAQALRSARNRSQAERAFRMGTRGVLADEYRSLQRRGEALADRGEQLRQRAQRLERRREQLESAGQPSLQEQLDQLESMNESQVEAVTDRVLNGDAAPAGVSSLLPTAFDGGTDANATMVFVSHRVDGDVASSGVAPQRIVDAQLALQDLAQRQSDGREYLVFGTGIVTSEIDSSMTDSLTIVGPLALLFVLLTLVIAYRDLVDILLGLFGIGAVLAWTFGYMGWMGIDFNQLFVAVPVLLIGLSIDYAIHIFMRHREERTETGEGPRGSMRVALSGVGIALVWVTATTVIGFLSNLTSPVPPIREFGVVSSVGIVAALLVFGVLIPSLKVEIDGWLEARGFDRDKRALGTGGGRFSSVLAVGESAARKAPIAVLVLTLLVTAGAAYGGAQVDTSFDQADFLAEEPPEWMEDLPDPLAPGEYTAKSNLELVNDRFVRADSKAQVVVEGDVATADAVRRLDRAAGVASDKAVTVDLSTAVRGPLHDMRQLAAENETFNATFAAADTDGDGVPDRNVEGVFDAFYEVAPDTADDYVYRAGPDDYRAVRLVVSVKGGASGADVTTQMRSVADLVNGDGLTATATGQAILNKVVQDQLLETVVQSLIITLVAVFAFLMVTYRIVEGSATLGAVTLLPVVLTVAWILGTMYLLSIPFNVLTGMITSLTVGLGVAYSIHVSERYNQELERSDSVWAAMHTAVTGTGGALLGSGATTVGGFGVLVFAILPPLQQFGLITAMTIVYAFLAAVLVLPTLLVVWTHFVGEETVEWGAPSPAAPVEDEAPQPSDD